MTQVIPPSQCRAVRMKSPSPSYSPGMWDHGYINLTGAL